MLSASDLHSGMRSPLFAIPSPQPYWLPVPPAFRAVDTSLSRTFAPLSSSQCTPWITIIINGIQRNDSEAATQRKAPICGYDHFSTVLFVFHDMGAVGLKLRRQEDLRGLHITYSMTLRSTCHDVTFHVTCVITEIGKVGERKEGGEWYRVPEIPRELSQRRNNFEDAKINVAREEDDIRYLSSVKYVQDSARVIRGRGKLPGRQRGRGPCITPWPGNHFMRGYNAHVVNIIDMER